MKIICNKHKTGFSKDKFLEHIAIEHPNEFLFTTNGDEILEESKHVKHT